MLSVFRRDVKVKVPPRVEAHRAALISVSVASVRHQINLQDTGHGASVTVVCRVVCLFTSQSQLSLVPNYTAW